MADPTSPAVTASGKDVIMQLLAGSRAAQVVHVAAQLGVPDQLLGGPRHYRDIARAVDAHPESLHRLLRAATSLGILGTGEVPGTFQLTPLSQLLTSDHPKSLRDVAIYNGIPEVHSSWGNLLHSVKTGECAFEHLYGKDMFRHMNGSQDTALAYNRAMTSFSRVDADAIIASYDFSSFPTVLDVGSGEGALLLEILSANPSSKGILLELPSVAAAARASIKAKGLEGRCRVLTGSFFEPLTIGALADACIFKNIILNWDDEHVSLMLRNCHSWLRDGGRVLVIEPILGKPSDSAPASLIDMNMLVLCPGGRLRTTPEHERLLAGAGFALPQGTPISGTLKIMEGVKTSTLPAIGK